MFQFKPEYFFYTFFKAHIYFLLFIDEQLFNCFKIEAHCYVFYNSLVSSESLEEQLA